MKSLVTVLISPIRSRPALMNNAFHFKTVASMALIAFASPSFTAADDPSQVRNDAVVVRALERMKGFDYRSNRRHKRQCTGIFPGRKGLRSSSAWSNDFGPRGSRRSLPEHS